MNDKLKEMDVEEHLDSGDTYTVSYPDDGTNIMELYAVGLHMDGSAALRFTRKELKDFIKTCEVFLDNA